MFRVPQGLHWNRWPFDHHMKCDLVLMFKIYGTLFAIFFLIWKIDRTYFSNIIPRITFFNPSSLLKTRPYTGKVQGGKNFTLNYVLAFERKYIFHTND